MFQNQFKTVVLLGVLSTLLVLAGGAVGGSTLHVMIVLAALMNLGAWFFSDRLVLTSSGAKEVSREEAPELHSMVADLAQRMGMPMPKVCVTPDVVPNAFATGRSPEKGVVAVTAGILQVLDRRELRGVIAHELAHIKNRDTLVASIAAAMSTAVSYVGNIVTFGAMFGGGQQRDGESQGGGGGALLAAVIAPIAATLVQLGISRSREYLADETAARVTGDPEALAMALLKLQRVGEVAVERTQAEPVPATAALSIVNPFAGAGRLLSLFSTHPPVEKRVERLRALAGQGQRLAV